MQITPMYILQEEMCKNTVSTSFPPSLHLFPLSFFNVLSCFNTKPDLELNYVGF